MADGQIFLMRMARSFTNTQKRNGMLGKINSKRKVPIIGEVIRDSKLGEPLNLAPENKAGNPHTRGSE